MSVTHGPSVAFLSLSTALGTFSLAGCASEPGHLDRGSQNTLVAPSANTSPTPSPAAVKIPSTAERLIEASNTLHTLVSQQSETAAFLKGPTFAELLEKAHRPGVLADLDARSEALLTLAPGTTPSVPELAAWWGNFGTVVAALHSNNLELQMRTQAHITLSRLAQNEVLSETFDKRLSDLKENERSLRTTSLAIAEKLRGEGVTTSSIRVTVSSPILAPEGLKRDWRLTVEGALRATEDFPAVFLLAPDQTAAQARAVLSDSLNEAESELTTTNAITEMMTARLLIYAKRASFMDQIRVSAAVRNHVAALPAERREKWLEDQVEMEHTKAMVRMKLLANDMKEPLSALARLERSLRRPAPSLDLGPAKLRLRP